MKKNACCDCKYKKSQCLPTPTDSQMHTDSAYAEHISASDIQVHLTVMRPAMAASFLFRSLSTLCNLMWEITNRGPMDNYGCHIVG